MKKQRKVGLFDLDGTLADYHNTIKKDLLKLKSPEEPLVNLSGNIRHPEYIENRKQLIVSQNGWWANLPKLEIGFKILSISIEIGFENMILTKGPLLRDNAWTEKVQWCKQNLPEDINITITTDKSLVYGRFLVDDYPDYAIKWLKWRPRGLVLMPKSEACIGFHHENVIICDGSARNIKEIKIKLSQVFNRRGVE